MKKILCLVAALAVVGLSQVHAGIDLLWGATNGFSPPGGDGMTMGILNPAINPSQSVLAQLIWSGTGTISPALGGSGARADFSSGDNQVVRSVVITTAASSEFADFSAPNWQESGEGDDNPWVPGVAFVRVFDAPAGSLDVGNWYYDSDPIALMDLAPALGFPQSLEVNRDSLGPFLGDALDQQIALIPEPSTLGLLALGVMGATLRRRRLAA